jgi:hypothetical protein
MLKDLSGKKRLSIALTLSWLVSTFFYVCDKSNSHICFLVLGLFPVAAIWGIYWVIHIIKTDKR